MRSRRSAEPMRGLLGAVLRRSFAAESQVIVSPEAVQNRAFVCRFYFSHQSSKYHKDRKRPSKVFRPTASISSMPTS